MNRKNVIIISIVFLFVFIFVGYNFLHGKNKIELDENSGLISIWVEDSSGNYQSANSYPGAGYVLNLSLSQCENGGTLSGDGTHVYLEAGHSDKCYLYFSTPWINVNATKTLTCNSSSKTFDYKINGATFDVSTDADLTCTATKSANATTQSFAQYIASLAGTTQGDGQLVNENGYRYEGKDPNNYIWFNNEMWRIIGVFGSARHGVTNDPRTINSVSDTYLVKIIRNEPIGGYAWDGVSTSSSNYSTSTIYRMLNGCYYNALTGNDTTNISGSNASCYDYCVTMYFYDNVSPKTSCDFSVIGLQKDEKYYGYRDMVENVTWYLGGPGLNANNTFYPANLYGYETNSSTVPTGYDATVSGYVGLMYLSDYGYSVLASNCARGSYTTSDTYKNTVCAGNSWLYGHGEEWTITQCSDYQGCVFDLTMGGITGMNDHIAQHASVRPVLYLKSKTFKLAGTGTKTNPYVVGLSVG